MQTLTSATSWVPVGDDYRQYCQSNRFEKSSESLSFELSGSVQEAIAVSKIVLRSAGFTVVCLAEGDIVCYKRSTVTQVDIGLKLKFSGLLPNQTVVNISWHQSATGALANQIDLKQKSTTASRLLELIQELWAEASGVQQTFSVSSSSYRNS